jgi:hypothetical protein
MDFQNKTSLDDLRLYELFLRHTAPYRHDKLTVRVRYSRSADFSGACYYRSARLTINLGRHNRYPYLLATHVARAQSSRTHWWRELFRLELADAYQLALFIYLHELFHFLVKAAGRNPRRKESMCDRFATRVLVDEHGCALRGSAGAAVPRDAWDINDLGGFVQAAPRSPQMMLPLHSARTGA